MKAKVILFLACFFVSIIGFGQEVDARLVGSWSTDNENFQISEVKGMAKDVTEAHLEKTSVSMKSRIYVFEEDGTFVASWIFNKEKVVEKGNWIARNGQLYLLTNTGSYQFEFKLAGENGLVLIPSKTGNGVLKLITLKRAI